jgi:hypothetical protein
MYNCFLNQKTVEIKKIMEKIGFRILNSDLDLQYMKYF